MLVVHVLRKQLELGGSDAAFTFVWGKDIKVGFFGGAAAADSCADWMKKRQPEVWKRGQTVAGKRPDQTLGTFGVALKKRETFLFASRSQALTLLFDTVTEISACTTQLLS